MTKKRDSRLLHGEILTQWTLLDPKTVERTEGDRAQLTNLLMNEYGLSRTRAIREVDRILDEVAQRLKMAA